MAARRQRLAEPRDDARRVLRVGHEVEHGGEHDDDRLGDVGIPVPRSMICRIPFSARNRTARSANALDSGPAKPAKDQDHSLTTRRACPVVRSRDSPARQAGSRAPWRSRTIRIGREREPMSMQRTEVDGVPVLWMPGDASLT